MTIRSLVRDYLRGLQTLGCRHLVLEEEVRPILREWMMATRRDAAGQVSGVGSVRGEQQSGTTGRHPAEEIERVQVDEILRAPFDEGGSEAPEATQEEEKVYFRPAGRSMEEIREQAERLLQHWEPLEKLGTLRTTPVWGEGSANAAMFFVGDAPNYYDEQSGKPFSGEAGKKLDEMLLAMGLTRDKIYLTHMVKLRPAVANQTLNNRPPNATEIARSLPMLEFEISHVRPRVIVALGVIAARGILQRGELPLSAYQEIKDAKFGDIPVVVTHHPSYLIRTTELSERRRLWEEMLRAMEIAQVPITDKQRRYFLPKR